MEEATTSELKNLATADENKIEPEDAFIDLDFATEDFINKNIRVRPVSGTTHADPTQDGKKSNVSGAQDDGEEAQENYNRLAHYELEIQRKTIKKKADDF